MLFSIVIPTHNNFPELKACLSSLEKLTLKDFEVLVCIDGSVDGTNENLVQLHPKFPLQILQHPGNAHKGRSATRNLALAKATGKYTLFLDSDMQAEPDLLDRHLDMLRKGISIGIVKYRNEAENTWAHYTSERGVGKFRQGERVPFQYFITPNTALPTEWWRTLGGFDENISRYGGEDMELGYRLHKKYSPAFYFNPAAVVRTTQDKTLDQALAQLQEYGATGLRYIIQKHPELEKIYWVSKCSSRKFGDQLFEFLTIRPFAAFARFMVRITPYFIQRFLINYLVIAHVHRGYRSPLAETNIKAGSA